MKFNVFLKSTIRQPVRAILIFLLIGVVSFLFMMRAVEYILVEQETERISKYYRSIGTLEDNDVDIFYSYSSSFDTDSHTNVDRNGSGTIFKGDYEAAAEYMEQNPYVKLVDKLHYCSGVTDSYYNVDTRHYADSRINEVFFYGTLSDNIEGVKKGTNVFTFCVDSVVTGFPQIIKTGDNIIIHCESTFDSELINELAIGKRYLVRASRVRPGFSIDFNYKITSEVDGKIKQKMVSRKILFKMEHLSENGPWILPAEENLDLSQPQYKDIQEEIKFVSDNQHSLHVIATADMSAMPETQEVSRAYYLKEGRWLNAEDNSLANEVCAVHANFAEKRGLKIGDSISMELRNIFSDIDGYITQYSIDNSLNGDIADIKKCEKTFEIVGIYDSSPGYESEYFEYNDTYIPLSVFPADFDKELARGDYMTSFELISPEYEEAFIAESKDDLASYGYIISMLENGFKEFDAATQSIRRSSLYNLIVFSLVLLMALCLITFIYFRFRRKDIAISRALGVPVKHCIGASMIPLMLIGFAAVLSGSLLAWRYVEQNAAELLRGFEDFGDVEAAVLPVEYMYLLCFAVFALMTVITFVFAVSIARKRVLTLLQGGFNEKAYGKNTSAVQNVQFSDYSSADLETKSSAGSAAELSAFKPMTIQNSSKSSGLAHIFSFVWRHIIRAHVKTALSVLLAAVFMVGLSMIHLSIINGQNKVDGLYNSIEVDVDLTTKQSGAVSGGEGYIYENTVRSILDLGFTSDYFVEAYTSSFFFINSDNPNDFENPDIQKQVSMLHSFSDLSKYMSGKKSYSQITYFEDWNETMFEIELPEKPEDFDILNEKIPAIFPQYLLDSLEIETGDTILAALDDDLYITFMVAGVYSEFEGILVPMQALKWFAGDNFAYSRARFNIDPMFNRELDSFRVSLDEIISRPDAGTKELSCIVWDEELNQAIKPLERNIDFMQVLYPVITALSMLIAAGTALLFTMMSAKEAAIMRVLGTSRLRSRIILCLQVLLTGIAGLAAGIAAAWILVSLSLPVSAGTIVSRTLFCATLYFIAAALGALISSAGVTKRNPLELLQVKE